MLARRTGVLPALLCCLALLCGLLVGCSHDTSHDTGANAPILLRAAEQQLLDQRAKAIRERDLTLFMRSVARTDKAFVAEQRRYFANMAQLPLQRFSYRVLDSMWPSVLGKQSWGKDLRLPHVQVVTQLKGYDHVPVRTTTGFGFATRHGAVKIVADRTRSGKPFPGSTPAPWDLTQIHVSDTHDVLALFDNRTWDEADQVTGLVEDGIRDVSAAVPFTWSGHVVVYAFQNKAVLNSFDGVPGGNIRHLGAMTFPVYASRASGRTAGMRFTLLPSSLKAGQPFLGRIIRHELTHVAVGNRDDGDPVWVAEGLAEYVGARFVPLDQRRIASSAVTHAEEMPTAMPASKTFNDAEQDWHYALSWMAFDYIADTQGEAKMWQLMNALHAGGRGTSDARQDAVVKQVLGYDSHELAMRAAARIRNIYG